MAENLIRKSKPVEPHTMAMIMLKQYENESDDEEWDDFNDLYQKISSEDKIIDQEEMKFDEDGSPKKSTNSKCESTALFEEYKLLSNAQKSDFIQQKFPKKFAILIKK